MIRNDPASGAPPGESLTKEGLDSPGILDGENTFDLRDNVPLVVGNLSCEKSNCLKALFDLEPGLFYCQSYLVETSLLDRDYDLNAFSPPFKSHDLKGS